MHNSHSSPSQLYAVVTEQGLGYAQNTDAANEQDISAGSEVDKISKSW